MSPSFIHIMLIWVNFTYNERCDFKCIQRLNTIFDTHLISEICSPCLSQKTHYENCACTNTITTHLLSPVCLQKGIKAVAEVCLIACALISSPCSCEYFIVWQRWLVVAVVLGLMTVMVVGCDGGWLSGSLLGGRGDWSMMRRKNRKYYLTVIRTNV